jgi:hypothetical protein
MNAKILEYINLDKNISRQFFQFRQNQNVCPIPPFKSSMFKPKKLQKNFMNGHILSAVRKIHHLKNYIFKQNQLFIFLKTYSAALKLQRL